MVRKAHPKLVATVGRRIKELRVARGLTQEGVAEILGIATKNVQRLESGKQNLTLATLQLLADVLDVEPHELLVAASPSVGPEGSLSRALRGMVRDGHEIFDGDAPAPRGAIPVLTLEAAASRFGEARDVSVIAWIKLKGLAPSQQSGRFVAQVHGRSMAPRIPSGALALFKAPVAGPLQGRVVVAQWRQHVDPETGGAYVLKRVGGVEAQPGGGVRLELVSDNHGFPSIFVEAQHASEVRIVAELERVLWPLVRR